MGVDTLVSRSYRDGGFFLTWMLLLFQQVCRAKRLYKGKFIDHQGCFRPIKKYRLIAGELPESDTIQDDRARKAIESVEKSHEKVLQQPLLYSSGEDDNNSFLGHSVEVPNNQSVYSPARVPYDPPVDSNVGKTPKIKNKKRQQSTKKRSKKKYPPADDGDETLDDQMASVTKLALLGKNAEATRHHEQMEALEEKKMTKLFEIEQTKMLKSIEQADRQFQHSVMMDERVASQQAKSTEVDIKTKDIEYQTKQFELRQKLYAAYTDLKDKGMPDKKIKVIYPEMATFFDDDESTISDATTQKPNKKTKK